MTDIYSGSTLRLAPIAMKVGNGKNRRKQLFFDPDSTPDCKVEEFQTFEVVDDLGTQEFILAATPSVQRRTFPSDYLPASIDECAADELIPEAITQAIRIRPNDSFDGPCYRALLDYLKSYVGTPHERDVWNHYYDWGRPHQDKLPLIERAAEKAGLSTWEYIAHRTLQELQRFVQANGIPTPIPDTSPDRNGRDVDTGDGWTWQAVRDELERLRLKGERYTSQRKMAERIGCTQFLIGKAIKNGSAELEEWTSKAEGQSRLNVAPEVSAMAFDRTPQQRENDPADILEEGDIDAALAYVIDQAGPEERARIHAMTPAERRLLAETAYRDEALAWLIDQASPEERARIHAMTPAERRLLAETAYRDPDT